MQKSLVPNFVLSVAAAVIALCGVGVANAGSMTFDVSWSGASLGNAATATAEITFDPSQLNNPGFTSTQEGVFVVTAFTMTVSGAKNGNGTFGLADFNNFSLGTNGGLLDFTRELVGQPTSGSPWGTTHTGDSGVFNIITEYDLSPTTTGFFQITPTYQLGSSGTVVYGFDDSMLLTSFAPAASPVPEPSSFALLGVGGLGLIIRSYRRRCRTVV